MKRFALLSLSMMVLLGMGCCYTCKLLKEPEPDQRQFLRDEYGRICIYHGVNINNACKSTGEPSGFFGRGRADTAWQQSEDFQRMISWGFNVGRMLWHWEAIEPQRGQFNKVYVQKKIKQIEDAGNFGIQAIVDIHQDLYTQRFCGNGFPDWTVRADGKVFEGCKEPWNLAYLDPAVITAFNNFWNNDTLQDLYVAMIDSVFRWVDKIPNVLGVDVMNEPIPDLSGKFERVKLTRLYTRIQNMVKAKGYKKLVIYEPWMSTSTGIPSCLKFAAGPGTVYSPHYYDMFVDAGKPYGPINHEIMKKAIAIKVREAQEFGSPIIYGEFGVIPKYLDFLGDLLDEFDRYGAGWMYYSYDYPQHCAFAFIDENKNPGPTLSALVRVYPMKIAGNNPEYGINGKTFTLKYDKIDSSQPTVIFVPETWEITVETAGQYERSGAYLLYTNTGGLKQTVKITWK